MKIKGLQRNIMRVISTLVAAIMLISMFGVLELDVNANDADTPGRVKVRVSQDDGVENSEFSVVYLDENDDPIANSNSDYNIGAVQNFNEYKDIPADARKIKVTVSDATSRSNLANARLERDDDHEDDLIDSIRRSDDHCAVVDVDSANGYALRMEFNHRKNVSWGYDETKVAGDAFVEHCTIKLCNADGSDYNIDPRYDLSRLDDEMYSYNLLIGAVYYFKLTPEYGYEISSLRINGYDVEPQNSTGVFRFTMSNSNFHFQGIVNAVDNRSEIAAGAEVAGAQVTGAGDAQTGTYIMNVEPATADEIKAETAVGEGFIEVTSAVDITLDNVMSKGDGTYWELGTDTSEMNQNVGVSLKLTDAQRADLAEGETFGVVREHDGVYEEIPSTYYAGSGDLDFDSNRFSTYCIVKKSGNPEAGEKKSKSSSSSSSSKSSHRSDKCSHGHDFQYQILEPASYTSDGRAAWVCRNCGLIDRNHEGTDEGYVPISGYAKFSSDVVNQIKEAPAGELTINAYNWISFPKSVYDAIESRPDLTVTVEFIYEGEAYSVTVPAGTSAQSILKGELFAGYLYLGSLFGLSNR